MHLIGQSSILRQSHVTDGIQVSDCLCLLSDVFTILCSFVFHCSFLPRPDYTMDRCGDCFLKSLTEPCLTSQPVKYSRGPELGDRTIWFCTSSYSISGDTTSANGCRKKQFTGSKSFYGEVHKIPACDDWRQSVTCCNQYGWKSSPLKSSSSCAFYIHIYCY